MKNKWVTLSLLVLTAISVHAQTTMNMPSNQIDGSQTPEQIPDIVAFRMWLDQNLPVYHWHTIGLGSVEDSRVLMAAVNSYKAKIASLAAAHDAQADILTSSPWPDAPTYSLVSNLWSGLQASMSANGLNQFSNYLKYQRRFMKVSAFDVGLGAVAVRNLAESRMVASAMPQGGANMSPNYGLNATRTLTIGKYDIGYSFTRPNGPLGSPWVTLGGSFAIQNNNLVVTSGGSGGTAWAYYNESPAPSANQSPELVLSVLPSSGQSIGLVAMVNPSQHWPSGTWYEAAWYNNGTCCSISLAKLVNGSPTNLQIVSNTTHVGDSLQLITTFGQVRAYINGVVVAQVSDSSITAAGYMGVVGTAGSGAASYWVGLNDYTLHSGVTLTGNTICPCPQGALHTGKAINTMGSEGGTTTGPQVTPQTSMTVQQYTDFDLPGWDTGTWPGGVWTGEGEVLCTIVGLFVGMGGGQGGSTQNQEETAITMSNVTGYIPPDSYPLKDWCNAASTPPDGSPTITFEAFYSPYWKSSNECERAKTAKAGDPWNCQLFTPATVPYPAGTPKYACTVYDKGISGRPFP